ncbi:hypothetical protein [Shimazuella kribbensis]|uniref:hypothetical protein n=1 Tax=Shimazuella kribbensis TaxID=139808 RepID=UPI000401094E|nr:hypothetical protein [Shimazuella kribbensis]
MLLDPKKGKYSIEENEKIIELVNEGMKNGERERDTIKVIANTLNRGYAGIMSHVRKLKTEQPARFETIDQLYKDNAARLNSWTETEEDVVIDTVNKHLENGKSLSTAISSLEEKLSRTQGAIYQRIYTLRRKQPDRFAHLPAERPRKKRKLPEWQTNRPIIRNLDRTEPNPETYQPTNLSPIWNTPTNLESPSQTEESMIYQAFESRYGKLTLESKEKLNQLMRQYGGTRVSISLLTLSEDKAFSSIIADFLAQKMQRDT